MVVPLLLRFELMRCKSITVRPPEDVYDFIVRTAAEKRMQRSDYVMRLLCSGLEAELLDATSKRLAALEARYGGEGGGHGHRVEEALQEMMREVLALRFIVTQAAVSPRSVGEDLSQQADAFATRELKKRVGRETA